jgi:flagellar hook-basal body complex protein FliE
MPSPNAAASAYAALARLAPTPADNAGRIGAAAGGGPSFSSLLADAVGSVLETGRKSDAQAQAVVAGKADIVDVVTAVAETEVAIQTLVSVRDRVIQSYEEIMRMPI